MNTKPHMNLLIGGSTKLSKIPGLTLDGTNPELTFLTPTEDGETKVEGTCKSCPDAQVYISIPFFKHSCSKYLTICS